MNYNRPAAHQSLGLALLLDHIEQPRPTSLICGKGRHPLAPWPPSGQPSTARSRAMLPEQHDVGICNPRQRDRRRHFSKRRPATSSAATTDADGPEHRTDRRRACISADDAMPVNRRSRRQPGGHRPLSVIGIEQGHPAPLTPTSRGSGMNSIDIPCPAQTVVVAPSLPAEEELLRRTSSARKAPEQHKAPSHDFFALGH